MHIVLNYELHHLIGHGTDHAPLHVTKSTSQEHVVKPFRFLNFWIKHKNFQDVVKQV